LSTRTFKASAPGSLMLLGEHAVLQGHPAIVCSVDQHVEITLKPRKDDTVTITSALGKYQNELKAIKSQAPFEFVLTAIQSTKSLPSGFDIIIESDLNHNMGLGSSAAVTVAMVNVLNQFASKKPAPQELEIEDEATPASDGEIVVDIQATQELFTQALEVVRAVQGKGSGADVAASVYGNCVYYRMDPCEIKLLANTPPIYAVYCGYKTPTPKVIHIVETLRQENPERYESLFTEIGRCAEAGMQAIEAGDWDTLALTMKNNHQLMDQLGVNDDTLQEIVETLEAREDTLAAKISGSGLGDCVVGLLKNAPGDD